MKREKQDCIWHTAKKPLTGDRYDDNLRRGRKGEVHYQCVYCGRWIWATDFLDNRAKGEVEKGVYVPYKE